MPAGLAGWLASRAEVDPDEAQGPGDELTRWLAALDRKAAMIEDPVNGGVGDDLLASRLASVAGSETGAYRRHRGWTTRLLESFRYQPFIPVCLAALLPFLLGARCSGPVAPNTPPSVANSKIGSIDDAVSTATQAAAQDVVSPQADLGARLYDRLCASCHGATGDGAGPAIRR
jgi:hypothetical protein